MAEQVHRLRADSLIQEAKIDLVLPPFQSDSQSSIEGSY